jgi:hypothetical protein
MSEGAGSHLLAILAGPAGAWHRFEGGDLLANPSRARWCLAPIPGGDLLAILTGADGAWHRFRGGFASDSNRGRWCLAPIPGGDSD